jgi:hypothetical protein
MGSDLTNFLLQRAGKSADNEVLFSLAKQAALKRHQGVPLNRAVVDAVKDQKLTDEQTRRVVELANSNAFLDDFESKPDDPIEFDLADSNQVLDSLHGSESGEAREEVKTASAQYLFYQRRPSHTPKGWEGKTMSKQASVQSPYTVDQVMDKLADAVSRVRADAALCERKIRSLMDDIVKEASEMLSDGDTVGDVASPLVQVLGGGTAEIMMAKVASLMGRRDYDVDLSALDQRRHLNPNHPLVDDCHELSKETKKLAEARGAERIILKDLSELESRRRDALRPRT